MGAVVDRDEGDDARLLYAALDRLKSDLKTTGRAEDDLVIVQGTGWQSGYQRLLFVGDALTGNHPGGGSPLDATDEASALWSVAECVQDYLVELRRAIWPQCAVHHRGAHLELVAQDPAVADRAGAPANGTPAWVCLAGPHTLATVGNLPVQS